MGTTPAPALAPASASEAMEMVHAGLGWLAAADAAALGAQTQARCLRMLEQASSMTTAARAVVLAAFTAGRGYSADADYSPRAWLMHHTGITRGAAAGHTAWARRLAAHPQVVAALAAKEMSESYGRTICQWTDKRAGQPVKALVHVSLADLMVLDGSSELMARWAAGVRARWAAARAAASVSGSDGGAWLDGDAARAAGCDASVTPVVTGEVDPTVLDDLVRLCVQLDHYRRRHDRDSTGNGVGDGDGNAAEGTGTAADGSTRQGTPDSDTSRARDALEQAIIGKAVGLLSGPGGLASFLRRRQLGARLGGPSLPLDVGVSSDIPAAIRRAVILRDQHCRFPGGCDQPAAGCEVHHLTHKADGGKTSVTDCGLFCFFHHQVVIHQWGWTVVLNPDGTTTAWNKDKTKVLHSHSPPARPG